MKKAREDDPKEWEGKRSVQVYDGATAQESDSNNHRIQKAWAQQAAAGIADSLMDSSEIITVNYKWEGNVNGRAGDLDNVVTGALTDFGPVADIEEAKLNLISGYVFEALHQVYQDINRWVDLAYRYGYADDEEDLGESDKMDIKKLRVGQFGDRQICVALSGAAFPVGTLNRASRRSCVSVIRVSHGLGFVCRVATKRMCKYLKLSCKPLKLSYICNIHFKLHQLICQGQDLSFVNLRHLSLV
ncbi:hypothetical protein CEUSTIGMA_g56.t1 [Chlamydomonas eustigma]|uniref:Uncharacterized protein n=1 Tax=Chlamydomonas eustigma TaxID=1157962 RepID=A0A250WPY1_9CHLO|nr:hypothetical protein CEUSTIGMA_g56.t1 [Chlamydomonas eustigma]|eukprot:GAX72600.1 hypothetical protein CEUSTIGMA_g56.t1 [Chlamydomonas eustigma]